jgi:hypothetical protein
MKTILQVLPALLLASLAAPAQDYVRMTSMTSNCIYRIRNTYYVFPLLATLSAVALIGCSTGNRQDEIKNTQTVGRSPEFVLRQVTAAQAAEIESISVNAQVPTFNPWKTNQQLAIIYSEWYRKGYAYSFVTGIQQLRDWQYRDSTSERARLDGWYNGNGAGGLARRVKEIEAAAQRLESQQKK